MKIASDIIFINIHIFYINHISSLVYRVLLRAPPPSPITVLLLVFDALENPLYLLIMISPMDFF